MRARTRKLAEPALLFLLLSGICAVRAVESFPHNTLSSIQRLVTHPGKYLEDATYSLDDEVAMKQGAHSKRWWKSFGSQNAMMGKPAYSLSMDSTDIPSRFSNNGGFLQLCLLLVFCMAVICCASVSINPWCKGDLHLARRILAGVWAVLSFLSNLIVAKWTGDADTQRQRRAVAYESLVTGVDTRLTAPSHQSLSKKAAKGRKRRTSHNGGASGIPPVQSRPIEKTVSNASDDTSSQSMSMDVELGQQSEVQSPDPVPLQPVVHLTPADAQIARLEAEAIEKQMHRLARQKQKAKVVPAQAKVEESAQGVAEGECGSANKAKEVHAQISSGKSEPLKSRESTNPRDSHNLRETGKWEVQGSREPSKGKLKSEVVEVKAYARRGRDAGGRSHDTSRSSEGDCKEKPSRRTHYEGRGGNVAQVLVVPRKSLYNKNNKPEIQTTAEHLSDKHLAPNTPDRALTPSNNAPSLLNSPQSLASPSRPYAEVAKENLPKTVWSIPPPPPPPPRKISALPKSAVYAQEFTPASHQIVAAMNEVHTSNGFGQMTHGQYLHGMGYSSGHAPFESREPRSLVRMSAPPASLEIPSAAEFSEGLVSTPSPFPGMSMTRKRAGIPVTSLYSNVLPTAQQAPLPDFGLSLSSFTSRAPSSTESDPTTNSTLATHQIPWPLEPGFPGIIDTIWGTGLSSRLENANLWNRTVGNADLVSDVSLASSSEFGSGGFGHNDPSMLTVSRNSF